LIICGFTKPEGSRFGFGALLLGYHDAATHVVKYAGKTGTGFTDAALREIHDALLSRIIKKSPFSRATGEHNVTWVRPELVCEVQFAQWTDDNRLRHASFRGLRKDKEAEDIVKEESIQEGPKKPRAGNSVVAGIEITHSSKIMEPASRLTKLDLAAYMEALSSELLRFAADRPLSLVRCPEGVGGPGSCFFQKHTTAGMPPAIKSIPGEKEDLVSISSKEGLIELAQFDVIEIHSWGSRITAPELADYIVLDLDPQPEVRWKAIARSALVVRDLLAEFGLTSFVKTTGGRGLHVVVPILPENNWETVRNVAHAMSLELQKRDPQNFTSMFSKSARKGNVFVDYLRNIRGATAIVPYSPRTRQHATVAMPLDWNDLDAVSPLDFTVRSAPDVVKKRTHDPWERFESSRKALPLKVKN
jgi:bifunctional non-homologous end joining protein LigD